MIKEFFEDCEIFVTGGSGAVGKALLDKLLRSCNVRCIYILLRSKSHMDVAQRVEKIKNDRLFKKLRETKPNELDKLIGIPGDVGLPNLGITPEYARVLANVSIFFHSAATVRFDMPIKEAINLNVGGTHEALKFALTLNKLKLFMHVSTFYSNPYLTHVESKLYTSPMDWRFCLEQMTKDVDEATLDILTKKMIVGFPNTYCFTKNLAEQLVNSYRDRLPVVIFRPSIVLQAASEPEIGYPPSLAGAMGLFAVIAAGILKTVYLKENVSLDITPQDFCIKYMMYYAIRGRQHYDGRTPDVVPVYTFSSYGSFFQTLKQLGNRMDHNHIWEQFPLEKNLTIPGCTFASCRYYYMLLVFVKEIPPALLADFLLKCFGHQPAVMSALRRTFITLEVMNPFRRNNYTSDGMSLKEDFQRDTAGTDFCTKKDLENSLTEPGINALCGHMAFKIREVLFNEDPKTLKRSRRIMRAKIFIYDIIRYYLLYKLIQWIYHYVTS